jgi:hypothetical protein
VATYGFGEGDAKRIGQTVRLTEKFPNKISLGMHGDQGAAPGVRMMVGTINNQVWDKGDSKSVLLFGGPPGNLASVETALVHNYFANIGTSLSTARYVGISNNGFGWILIAAECD